MMKKILALIFIGLLLVPAVAWLIDLDFGIPVHRIGLRAPQIYTRALLDNQYYTAFDQYYNDRFSLRSPLVFAKRWVDLHIFRMTDTPEVHVGNEGWLYSRRSIENLHNEICASTADAEQIALNLYTLEKLIEASGRRFYFTVVPDKSTIYPEFVGYLPQYKGCNRSRYDLVIDAIAAFPQKYFVRLDQLLKEVKSGHALLYDKTSAYWNEMGARVAAEEIQRQIVENPRREAVLDYTAVANTNPDDLYRQLMGFKSTTGDKPVRHFSGTGQSGHPVGIVYGNNFMPELLPYLQQMFNRLDLIRADRIPSRKLGEDLRNYDVVLLAIAESELDSLEIDIGGLLAMFENNDQIAGRHPFDLQAAEAVSDISLSSGNAGLEIKSVGGSSAFELKSLPVSDRNIFRLLKLSIETPQPNIMTIRYLTARPYYFIQYLTKGITRIYLPLPFQKLESLQIRPGNQPGVFTLGSAQILEFVDKLEEEDQHPQWLIVAATDLEDDFSLQQSEMESNSEPKRFNSEPQNITSIVDSEIADPEKGEPYENSYSSNIVNDQKDGIPNSKAGTETDHTRPPLPGDIALIEPDKKAKETSSRQILSGDSKSTITQTASIAVTDFEDGRIFQRTGRGADIVVSGSYTGKPGAIEARVVRDHTHAEVVTWTVMDASPQNGIYVGVIPDVPQGGWYNIQVRQTKNRMVSAGGTHRWGIGILVACLGQSNMKEWFYTGTDLISHSLLRKFSSGTWLELGRKGNAATAFGNRLIERLGIPVGFLDYSVNGSGLRKEADWGTGYWEDTARRSIYNQFVTGVSKTGGAVEFVIWIQGEADAARGTVTEEEYRSSLENFISKQVRVDIENGSLRERLPFLIVAMVKRPGGKDDPHQAVRNAQYRITEEIPDCYLAATTLDLKNQGRQHLTAGAYSIMGSRVAQTVLFVLGEEAYHRGPAIANAKQIDSRTIDVKIAHRGGSDFTPVLELTGWEVYADDKRVPLTRVLRHDWQTIRIVLNRPLTQKAMIRYLYGAMPDAAHPVVDNSAMSLPLEEGQVEVN